LWERKSQSFYPGKKGGERTDANGLKGVGEKAFVRPLFVQKRSAPAARHMRGKEKGRKKQEMTNRAAEARSLTSTFNEKKRKARRP